MVVNEPFCKVGEDFEPPLAGPVSKKFSLASCVYTIRFGHWPWHDLDPEARVQKLIRNEFQSISADPLFDNMTKDCWQGEYQSVAAVKKDILSRLGWTAGAGEELRRGAVNREDTRQCLVLEAECTEFMAKQALGRRRL